MIKSEARGKEEGKKVSGNRIVEQEEHKGDDNPENRRWLLSLDIYILLIVQ